MKFIIAPAKKMVVAQDDFPVQSQPQFRDQAAWLLRHMQQLTRAEAQTLWHTSEKLTGAAYEQLQTSDVTARQSPAIFSYVGIQYQYMAPDLLDDAGLAYIQQHLRILSGLYGILRPFDGIVPYRLEMQTHLAAAPNHNLYDFWGDRLYQALATIPGPIINLASDEYAKTIRPYLQPADQFINVRFAHDVNGKLKTRATYAKMARGEMVRYAATHRITTVEELTHFDSPTYRFDAQLSTTDELVFIAK